MSDHVLVVGFIIWAVGALVILVIVEKDFRDAFITVGLAILVAPAWPFCALLVWADDRLPKVRRISGTALARFAEASTHETYGWSLSRGWRGVIVIRRGPSTRGIPTRGHDVERYHDDDV